MTTVSSGTSFYYGMSTADQQTAITNSYDTLYANLSNALAKRYDTQRTQIQSSHEAENARIKLLGDTIDTLTQAKNKADTAVSQLSTAQSSAQSVLDKLGTIYSAIGSGSGSALNAALVQINVILGSRQADQSDPDSYENLLGSVSAGSKGSLSYSVNTGNDVVTVPVQSLTSNFKMTDTATGAVYTPNYYNQTMNINGTQVSFAKLSFVSRDGDTVTIEDDTDPDNPQQYSVKYQSGGLAIGPSFIYGDLSDPDNKAAAMKDITSSINATKTQMDKLSNAQSSITVDTNMLDGKINSTNSTLQSLSKQVTDETSAENTAAATKYQLTLKSLAFAAKAQRQILTAMLSGLNTTTTTSSIYDVMSANLSGAYNLDPTSSTYAASGSSSTSSYFATSF